MHSIGIDMSKDSFHVAFENENVLKFQNTEVGIEAFMTTLTDGGFSATDTRIAVEATGAYHPLFAVTLSGHEWDVFVINPLESRRMITQGLHTVKTDRLDEENIRDMAVLKKGYLFTDTKETLALKALVVERQALVEMRKAMKQRMTVHRLKEIAVGSTFYDGISSVKKALDQAIKELERQMQVPEQETQTLLRSIPGIGVTSAATLVAFISNIHRFERSEKLVPMSDSIVESFRAVLPSRERATSQNVAIPAFVMFSSTLLSSRDSTIQH